MVPAVQDMPCVKVKVVRREERAESLKRSSAPGVMLSFDAARKLLFCLALHGRLARPYSLRHGEDAAISLVRVLQLLC